MKKELKLLVFDLDGTLIDSQEGIVQGINFALKKVGLKEKSSEEISSYIGRGVDYLVQQSLGKGKDSLFEKTKTILDNYRQDYPDNARLYPGVKDILEYFRNKTKVIITNREKEFALPALKVLRINGYFADIVGADDVECMKPSPCPLDYAVKKFKMNKEKTMMVGDMDVDVLAGKHAGILTCAVTYGIGKKEDILKAGPDYIIDDISQLKTIIK
jgi:HAD superfamily hydrolase (TIGR01549 family)